MYDGQVPYIDGSHWVFPDGRRLARVAGGEETEEEKAEREKREAEAAKKDEKPPWGDEEENFDAARAWELIQDLRGDLKKVKGERDDLRQEKKERDDAAKTEEQKRDEAKAEAEKNAAKATQEAARLRVALKKGLTETQAKRLVGDSEEDLEKDADELLASFKNEEEENPEEGGQAPRRPTERLKTRSGAAPEAEPDESDPAKLAAGVSRDY